MFQCHLLDVIQKQRHVLFLLIIIQRMIFYSIFLLQLVDGWSAEGSEVYKWAQYENPPIIVNTNKPQGNDEVVDLSNAPAFDFPQERTPMEQSEKVIVFRVPFFGNIQFLKHKQGIIQASVVLFYWIYGSWSIYTLVLKPHRLDGNVGNLSLLCKCVWFRFKRKDYFQHFT